MLNGARNILTLVTMKRIQHQVDMYTNVWQCGYKQGRSCADIVWAQRMLISVVMRKHYEYHKMGIDMSSAFDTISRTTILRLLDDAGCSSDDIRLVRYLLAETRLVVRVNNSVSVEFLSTKGSFQGDAGSGLFFTLTFAGALNHLRAVSVRPNPPISERCEPLEWEYADDCDFGDESHEDLEELFAIAKSNSNYIIYVSINSILRKM